MLKLTYREFMYIGFVLLLPITILFKGAIGYALLFLFILLILIFFDPLFKRFRKHIHGANKFICIILSSGFACATLSLILPQYQLSIVLLFGVGFYLYLMRISRGIEIIKKK